MIKYNKVNLRAIGIYAGAYKDVLSLEEWGSLTKAIRDEPLTKEDCAIIDKWRGWFRAQGTGDTIVLAVELARQNQAEADKA